MSKTRKRLIAEAQVGHSMKPRSPRSLPHVCAPVQPQMARAVVPVMLLADDTPLFFSVKQMLAGGLWGQPTIRREERVGRFTKLPARGAGTTATAGLSLLHPSPGAPVEGKQMWVGPGCPLVVSQLPAYGGHQSSGNQGRGTPCLPASVGTGVGATSPVVPRNVRGCRGLRGMWEHGALMASGVSGL